MTRAIRGIFALQGCTSVLLIAMAACTRQNDPAGVGPAADSGADARAPTSAVIDAKTDELLAAMTLDEKLAMMAGKGALERGLWPSPGVPRLGVPDLLMTDGPRGLGATQWLPDDPRKGTAFPVGMARGATFDVELEERVGRAIGEEVRAFGGNVILAPVVNVLRHPAWGRAQETYGEDPAHLGALGSAFVRGAQRHVIANPKHFAVNDIEDSRFTVSVNLDERTLREVFLSPFKATVDEGALSVMTAYNRVNGTYAAEQSHLIRDVLQGEWGFRGFVESDWILGTRSTVPSVLAGLAIEMPSPNHFHPDKLKAALDSGEVPLSAIDDAVRRIVRSTLALEATRDPAAPAEDAVGSASHASLALEVAQKSIVLLRNEGRALPLERSLRSLALVGTFAGIARLGDDGSSKVVPAHAVTPLEGLRARAPGVTLEHVDADVLAPADEARVAAAAAAVVVVGLSAADERENIDGKGGDRESLSLSPDHVALVQRVSALNPRTVVVVEAGSAVTMAEWQDLVPAIVLAFYPGQEGGTALADVLFGDVNPSGHLPLTIPVDASQLPPFDPVSAEVTYGYLHGYRYVDSQGTVPAFPFGFGLGYTTFELSLLHLSASSIAAGATVTATFDVENTGDREGDEIVQLYVGHPGSALTYGPRELRAFSRVHLAAGERRTVTLPLHAADLSHYDVDASAWKLEARPITVSVGTSSRDLPLEATLDVK